MVEKLDVGEWVRIKVHCDLPRATIVVIAVTYESGSELRYTATLKGSGLIESQ